MTSALGKVASGVGRAGGAVVRKVRSVFGSSAAPAGDVHRPASGWLVVTVLCGPSEIDTAALPAPLAEFGNRIEVRVRPAADSKGTELAARLRGQVASGTAPSRLTGTDPQADLRSALLETWTKAAPKAGVR